jgi:hypothetical protein
MSHPVDQRASATRKKRRIIVSSVAFISTMPARTSSTGSPLSAARSSTASASPGPLSFSYGDWSVVSLPCHCDDRPD